MVADAKALMPQISSFGWYSNPFLQVLLLLFGGDRKRRIIREWLHWELPPL